jgi:hypothetical protein
MPSRSAGFYLAAGWGLLLDPAGNWIGFLLRPVSAGWVTRMMAALAGASLLFLGLAVALAGYKIRQAWQEEPPPPWQLRCQRLLCTPLVWVSLLHWWMGRKLARNPVGWLEQRTWSGRLVTWGWLAVVVSLYSAGFSEGNFFNQLNSLQHGIAWLMAGSVALSAAGSFRRERETGLMELLLVSPLSAGDIVWGRLRGLWGQFLPAFSLLLGAWLYLDSIPYMGLGTGGQNLGVILMFGMSYLTLPVVGLYFSLRCRNLITAFLATLAAGVLMPLLVPRLIETVARLLDQPNPLLSVWLQLPAEDIICQLSIALFCWARLSRRLRRRAFPLDRHES